MDYRNKFDDSTMKLRGQQTIITYGGHIFPLSMKNGLCHLEKRIPTDEEMCVLPQVIYNDKIPMSEYIKHLPLIPAGEIKNDMISEVI